MTKAERIKRLNAVHEWPNFDYQTNIQSIYSTERTNANIVNSQTAIALADRSVSMRWDVIFMGAAFVALFVFICHEMGRQRAIATATAPWDGDFYVPFQKQAAVILSTPTLDMKKNSDGSWSDDADEDNGNG